MLDAIYYCSFTKSYFSSTDLINISKNKEGFRLQGNFIKDDNLQNIVCIYKLNGKKELSSNDVIYEKLSHHIGELPCVMIAPDDIEIINGGSELRRKYIDTILSQLDKEYLQHLINYNKILQQRNSFLKQASESGQIDLALLEIFDAQLLIPADYISKKRIQYTQQLLQLINEAYAEISDAKELINIVYQSQLLQEDMASLLIKSRDKDRMLQRTNVGIHKDDLIIELNQHLFKSIASQGQKKSLLFALKLAEHEIIKQYKGIYPLLLLDDVFEKLDRFRMENLLKRVCIKNQGQVFFTDTHSERLEEAFDLFGIKGQIINLQI